jgi:hypothetical protein
MEALTPASNIINSRNSDASAAVVSQYHSRGYWPQPPNPSYPVGSAFAQQWPNYIEQPLNSLSMNFQTQNTNSLATTKGFPSPYDNLSLFPTSMGSSGFRQQQRINASQQRSSPPIQQDFIDHYSRRPPLTPTYYSPSSPPPPSFPLMKQSPNRSPPPSNRTSPLSTHSHLNVTRQNDRPFKCDQCPQSFNRSCDLKRHKKIHLKLKPFPCRHCEKSFSRKDALKVRSLFDLIRRLEAS